MGTINAIIVAGGSGIRFGEKKQFLPLGGIPVLVRTAQCFDIPPIDHIVVVVPQEDIPAAETMLRGLRIRYTVVEGGGSRQASVWCGLGQTQDSRIVLIHDGVRPFASSALIHRVLSGIEGFDACIPGLPMTDTIKEITDHSVAKTIPRSNVYQIQTPQAFFTDAITKSHEKAMRRQDVPTDDSTLIENDGGVVRVVDGDPYNIKITLPEDMVIAEAILKCLAE